MYSDREIYLMDDPLAALDTNVGRQLFERCLLYLVRERHKTVVFVTHHIQVSALVMMIVMMMMETYS